MTGHGRLASQLSSFYSHFELVCLFTYHYQFFLGASLLIRSGLYLSQRQGKYEQAFRENMYCWLPCLAMKVDVRMVLGLSLGVEGLICRSMRDTWSRSV